MCFNNKEIEKGNPWKIIDDRDFGEKPSLWKKFVSRIDTDPDEVGNECVNWFGYEGLSLYDELFKEHLFEGPIKNFQSIKPSLIMVNRLSWEMANGSIPNDEKEYMVKRICGNDFCVNPYHLELDTRKKTKEIKRNDPKTFGFQKLLPIWIWEDGRVFDRDTEIAKGYNYVCYKVTNKKNLRSYIGYTDIRRKNNKDISRDFIYYTTSSKDKGFKTEMREYPERFIREILSVHKTKAEALAEEERLTEELDENGVIYWKSPVSYNRNKGGSIGYSAGEDNPMFGKTHTPEARKAISEGNKGNQNALGHRKTDEQKKRNSEISKQKWQDPEYIKKMEESCYVKKIVVVFENKKYLIPSVKETIKLFGIKSKGGGTIINMVERKNLTFNETGIKIHYAKDEDNSLPKMGNVTRNKIEKIMKEVHRIIQERVKVKPVCFEYENSKYEFKNKHVFYDWLKGDDENISITAKMVEDWTLRETSIPGKCGLKEFRYVEENETIENISEPTEEMRQEILKRYELFKIPMRDLPCEIEYKDEKGIVRYENFHMAASELGLTNHKSVTEWCSCPNRIPVSRGIKSVKAIRKI